MKLGCGIWILWTTIASTTAPDVRITPAPPALSFVFASTGVYELEDTAALIWRNNDKLLTEKAFYFSHIIFACSELTQQARAIEQESTTKGLAFIHDVVQPPTILTYNAHPQYCTKMKRYQASVVPIIRLNNRYIMDPTMNRNRNRQEFSIGYEVSDFCEKLNGKGLPLLERFDGLVKGSGWLEAFKVVYDIENLIVRQVSYELNFLGSSETAPGQCENFKLGKEHDFLKVINFAKAYKRAAQIGHTGTLSEVIRPRSPQPQPVEKANVNEANTSKLVQQDLPNLKKSRLVVEAANSIPTDDGSDESDEIELIDNTHSRWDIDEHFCLRSLTDFNNPTTSTASLKTQGELSKSNKRPQPSAEPFDEPSDEEYMVMQQLAPIEYFDVFSIQWVTCTYLNVVPMWRSLASGPWKKVDQAIRKMLYVIDKLSIVAGTHGVLQLPKQRPPNQYQDVSLQSVRRNITIPMLFYKFVVHKVPIPGRNGASMSYGIIIVMHNNFGVPTNKICPKDPIDLCSDYGWDVGSKDDKIAKPYCCKPSIETLKALDITPYSSHFSDLDLNKVVLEITDTRKNIVRNYNQFQNKQYEVVAKKKPKTKKLNDIYF